MIVATAGHVDHGKTLLVKALTGVDTDRLEDEKRRGLTIDLGFAYQTIDEDTTLGFVDVPGHIRFIGNMLAGVGGIDCALLVVAADDGPMPQTREHLSILHLLGVRLGVVALTKCDRVDRERVDEVRSLTADLLRGTLLENAPIVPLSAVTGEGVEELRDRLAELSRNLVERSSEGHFRLAIDRSFTLPGAGVIVTGSVFSGRVEVGDELTLSPAGLAVRVRRIHAQDRESRQGRTGERCAINIAGAGIRRDEIHRGNWLLHPALHAPTDRFDARVHLLPGEERPLRHGTPVHIHAAANHVTGRVALLDRDAIDPGGSGLVQLICQNVIAISHSDRLILRDQGATRTIGGGTVLDPFPPRRGRSRPIRVQHLLAMEHERPEETLAELLELYPGGVNLSDLFRARNLVPERCEALLRGADAIVVQLRSEGRDHRLGFSRKYWSQLADATVNALAAWHAGNPDTLGPTERQLRNVLRPIPPPEVFAQLVSELAADARLRKTAASLHLPDHSAGLNGSERDLWQRVARILEGAALRPPVVHELAAQLKIPVRNLQQFLNRAVQLGLLVRVVPNRYFLPDSVRALGKLAEALAAEQPDGRFSASQYRDRSGIGRNLTIEVLEYFDGRGLTRRDGDRRSILRASEQAI